MNNKTIIIKEVPENKEAKEVYKPSFHLVPKNSKGEPDKNAWLKMRQNSIGASEIDSILGLNKWSGPEKILGRKLGIKENITPEARARMDQGNIREEEIINLYRRLKGLTVESLSLKDKIYYNPLTPFLTASLDGLVRVNDGEDYIIDAKLSKTYFWSEGDSGYYYGQAQQQLYVMGLLSHEFVVLNPEIPENQGKPEDLKIIPVKRNENFIRDMIIQAKDFWDEVLKQRELKSKRIDNSYILDII